MQFQPLFCNGHEKVDDDGHPDLRLHGVGRGAVEGLDPQMPLDPFEKQLHLPSLLVDVRDGLRRHGKEVGEEHEAPVVFRVVKNNAAKRFRVGGLGSGADKGDDLIRANAAGLVHEGRGQTPKPQIALAPDDEERRQEMDRVEAREIEIPAIHGDDGLRRKRHGVQDQYIVDRGGRHAHEGGDGALEIQQRVHLDGRLRLPEGRPREDRKTQVDGGGVEGVKRTSQFDLQFLALVQLAGGSDQGIPDVLVDPKVPPLVRVGQGGTGDLSPQADVIEFLPAGGKTRVEVAQGIPAGELREGHRDELIPTGERANAILTAVPLDGFPKRVAGQMGQQLGENGGSRVHGHSPPGMALGECYPKDGRKN